MPTQKSDSDFIPFEKFTVASTNYKKDPYPASLTFQWTHNNKTYQMKYFCDRRELKQVEKADGSSRKCSN